MEPLRRALRREIQALLVNLKDPQGGQRLSAIAELGRSFRGHLSRDVAQWVQMVEAFRSQGDEARRREIERSALKIIGETIEL